MTKLCVDHISSCHKILGINSRNFNSFRLFRRSTHWFNFAVPSGTDHNAHPHLVSPEPWLKAPSPHWQPVTPALQKHTSHSSQASDLVSTKWTPEAISDIFPLLTFLLTYLLCPLQHGVLRSPVSSFSSDLLSVHPSLILRCVVPSVSTSSCQDIYPLVIYSSSHWSLSIRLTIQSSALLCCQNKPIAFELTLCVKSTYHNTKPSDSLLFYLPIRV